MTATIIMSTISAMPGRWKIFHNVVLIVFQTLVTLPFPHFRIGTVYLSYIILHLVPKMNGFFLKEAKEFPGQSFNDSEQDILPE